MAAGEVIGNGNPSGSTFGSATTELISFYGVTPVDQAAMTVAVGTDLATVILELAEIRAALVAIGMIDA